jgi:hypothetical protein
MVEVSAAGDAPGQVFGHEDRLHEPDQPPQPGQVMAVELVGAPEREADRVEPHRVRRPNGFERAERRPAAEVILGVDLEPGHGGAGREDLDHVRRAQADPYLPWSADRVHDAALTDPAQPWRDFMLPPTTFSQVPFGT